MGQVLPAERWERLQRDLFTECFAALARYLLFLTGMRIMNYRRKFVNVTSVVKKRLQKFFRYLSSKARILSSCFFSSPLVWQKKIWRKKRTRNRKVVRNHNCLFSLQILEKCFSLLVLISDIQLKLAVCCNNKRTAANLIDESHDMCSMYEHGYLTKHFTIWEPHSSLIDEFHTFQFS